MAEPVFAQRAPFWANADAGTFHWRRSRGQSRNRPFCGGKHTKKRSLRDRTHHTV